jgi:L-lactate dehydrogenase
LVLVDVTEDRLKGEVMDLQHGLAFVHNINISSGSGKNVL